MPDNPFDFIIANHFKYLDSSDDARGLFKQSIRMVEIEVFSYCNRKCWFCPNATIDRYSKNEYMNEDGYLKILSELAEIDYSGMISYSRYNEPLADRIILTRLEQARKLVPRATLHTNTNGDYATREFIEELYEYGLRSLNIQIYQTNSEEWSDAKILKRLEQKLIKIGFPSEMVISIPDEYHEARMYLKDMNLRVYGRNFEQNGCNRGELVDIRKVQPIRTSPCLSPFYHVYIDYNGNAMPCCNLRSDAPEHNNYIIGNIREATIFDLYANSTLVEWRKRLIDYKEKAKPCDTCSFITFEKTTENLSIINRINCLITDRNFSFRKLVRRLFVE